MTSLYHWRRTKPPLPRTPSVIHDIVAKAIGQWRTGVCPYKARINKTSEVRGTIFNRFKFSVLSGGAKSPALNLGIQAPQYIFCCLLQCPTSFSLQLHHQPAIFHYSLLIRPLRDLWPTKARGNATAVRLTPAFWDLGVW